jgi:hypothetical protein
VNGGFVPIPDAEYLQLYGMKGGCVRTGAVGDCLCAPLAHVQQMVKFMVLGQMVKRIVCKWSN